MGKLEIVLVLAIIIVFSIAGIRLYSIFSSSAGTVVTQQTSSLQSLQTGAASIQTAVSAMLSDPSSQVSESIQNSELLASGTTNANFWYNEKFISGDVSTGASPPTCTALSTISPPRVVWGQSCYKTIFGKKICIPVLKYLSQTQTSTTYTTLVGYMGFPQPEGPVNSLFEFGSLNCNPSGKILGGYNYPNLVSADIVDANIYKLYYCLPTNSAPNNDYTSYSNFIDWDSSAVKQYGGASGYYYAINTSFSSGSAVPPGSTLIIPSVSCGATFVNNYINFEFGGKSIPAVFSLSGFTPSVGLATDANSLGVTYSFGGIFWPGISNALFTYSNNNIDTAFNYSSPTLNYAQFPVGNKGDEQYINVSGLFEVPVNSTYFGGGKPNESVDLYESNITFASISGLQSFSSWNNLLQQESFAVAYDQSGNGYDPYPYVAINTYTLPNLEATYYPQLGSGSESDLGTYDYFRTDGVFPFCGWNSNAGTDGAIYSNCTFENPRAVNPESYSRYSSSGYVNNLGLQPYSPGLNTADQLDSFTEQELNSYCFYGESFSTTTGVYTPPSYTRIIPPTALENYTSAIGKCNAFFNNTNCFSPDSSYINFNDGIFSSDIECTPNGISVKNVTDAWMSSIYIANPAGNFCGYFLGQKNITNPTANSTMFLQNISTGCPTFNSNDSEVPLVITVKNVGTSNITRPYLVALFRDTNVSQMFYSNPSSMAANYNSMINNYNLYSTFISAVSQKMLSTGVLELRYNSAFETSMYYYQPGYPLNPIPVAQLFASAQNLGYLNGPYNNSLLGLWMYLPGRNSEQNSVIRTANTFLVHTSSNDSGVPKITPNGTATFTVEIPMGLFKAILSGAYNVSVYFGNSFNVSWAGDTSGTYQPTTTILSSSPFTVSPLVSSGTTNNNLTHNNEMLDPSSYSLSPPWQYLVSYTLNFTKKPFNGISIYSDNLNFSVGAPGSTQSVLNVTLTPSVSVQNGTGSYKISQSNLIGSSISCFASQENVNDFSVFWSVQDVSPPNIKYSIQNFYNTNGAVDNVLIKRWLGLVFMPSSDEAVLNYNNLPMYPISSVSMQLQKPYLNQSTGAQYSKEAFVYFGSGNEAQLYQNLSDTYNLLSESPTLTSTTVPSSLYGFTLTANSLVGNRSVIRIAGTSFVQNYSTFSNQYVTLSFYNSNVKVCSVNGITASNQSFSVSPSNQCLATILRENGVNGPSYINHTTLIVNSTYGPFYSELYNSSSLNLSNTVQGGTLLVSTNITSQTQTGGYFTTSLGINQSLSDGLTLLFGLSPQSSLLRGSDIYLYYVNDTPFNCNIVNDLGPLGNNMVSSIGSTGSGEYDAPNGTILCNLTSPIPGVRAVFVNSTTGQYLGSGDIGLGIAVQNISGKSLFLTEDGVPINSQSVNLTSVGTSPIGYGVCNLRDAVIYNGILNYSKYPNCILPKGNYIINFTSPSQGQEIFGVVDLPSIHSTNLGGFLMISPSAVADNPSYAYNLSLNSQSIPSSVPVSFSLPDEGGCNSIKILSNFPYPYAEVPYQAVSSSGQCTYEFILDKAATYSGENYLVFSGVSPSPFSYSNNWLNTSSTPYNVLITTNNYTTNLLGNCQVSSGPCLGEFSMHDTSTLGNLLINNVSASQSTIVETIAGPVTDCFVVSYTASQQVIWKETGFGGITYNSNQLYQITNPSQQVLSTYCFYNGAPLITDAITSAGSPLSFSIGDNLISNFSFSETNNGQKAYVPPPISVGASGYSEVNISKLQVEDIPSTDQFDIHTSCVSTNSLSTNQASLPIPSSYISNLNQFYCIFGGEPTYSPQGNNVYTTSGGENVSLDYLPGTYNLSTNGVNSTIYSDCDLTKNITSTSQVQVLLRSRTLNETLFILSWPRVSVNQTMQNYNPNNLGEAFLADYTAPISNSGTENLLYSSVTSPMIASCPVNEIVKNYTACISPVVPDNGVITQVIPQNGSYDSIEAIPNLTVGNYNNSKYNYPSGISPSNTYGPNNYIGGGCFVGVENGVTYSCAPTDGTLSLVPTGQTTLESSTGTVTYSMLVYENAQTAPLTINSASFSCSGWIYAGNQSSGPATQYSNLTVSCANGGTGTNCASSIGLVPAAGGLNTFNLQTTCSAADKSSTYPFISSQSLTIKVSSVSATQSELTKQFGNLTCGNVTDLISLNVRNGATWTPFATTHTPTGYPIAEVGGCEAGRDVYNITAPNISIANVSGVNPNGGKYVQYGTYSCPSGYSGSILSCASMSGSSFSGSITNTYSCTHSSYTTFGAHLVTITLSSSQEYGTTLISSPGYGAVPTGCNSFSTQGYTAPTVADGCVAYHLGEFASTNASYVLQYMNSSLTQSPIGIAIGTINLTSPTNVSIPPSGERASIKDQYMTSLSVDQYESTNIFTEEYPTSLLLSSQTAQALFKSSLYPYEMLNVLMIQNPYFKVYGIPAFVNGSVFDYALDFLTGGTSANCPGSSESGDYGIFNLGEGQLCSGSDHPAIYSNGIYLSLGTLNQGLHTLQFYSVSETGNTSNPQVTLYDSASSAYSLNSACSNNNSRVFTSTYAGGKWTINLTSDEECNPINNKLYGYIVNCIYQTPGNTTYTSFSNYYLGYNLPTLWNISYTLLVSPKTYKVVPVPVYEVNSTYGSFLSLYLNPFPVNFVETGLPTGIKWSVTFSSQTQSSNTNTISFMRSTQSSLFSVATSSNKSESSDCTTYYAPSPSSGSVTSSSRVNIVFSGATLCTTTFLLSGTKGVNWSAEYNGVKKFASASESSIEFVTVPGTFSVSAAFNTPPLCLYQSSYQSNAQAGSNVLIYYTAYGCSVDFFETGLPPSYTWNLTYNGMYKSGSTSSGTGSSSSLGFTTSSPGNFEYTVYKLSNSSVVSGNTCTTTYTPSTYSGSVSSEYPFDTINYSSLTECTVGGHIHG
jgi:hypothetical protein